MQDTIVEYISILKEKGFKLTKQRKVVIEALLKSADEHLSAEELYNIVKIDFPEIGLATVYRTVQILDDSGIIVKSNFNDGYNRYELKETGNDGSVHRHHHLVCLGCSKVVSMKKEDLLKGIEGRVAKENSFRVVDHDVKFYGYCETCEDKGEEKLEENE